MGNLGLTGIANMMYADYRSDSISDNETGAYWEKVLEMAAASTDSLLLQGAYAYAFPYADVIVDVPVFSSQFDVEDEAVPFYEMVVGGSAALYSTPVNESGNVRAMLLKAVEYGVSPSFRLMTAPRDSLQDTEYQKYYAVCWGDWEQEIKDIIKEFEVLDDIFAQRIVSHEKLGEKVYATTFEKGDIVYVNYGQEDVDVDQVTVPAWGFVRKGDK